MIDTPALVAASSLLVLALSASPARAEPWLGWSQGKEEEAHLSGDLDIEDLLTGAVNETRTRAGQRARAGTWVSIGGFWRALESGSQDVGLLLVAGVAFERSERGSREIGRTAVFAEGTPLPPAPRPSPAVTPGPRTIVGTPAPNRVVVTPAVARRAVQRAWQTAGLGLDDAHIEAIIARARASGVLPEARFRAMRVFLLDGSQTTVVPIDTSTYGSAGATLVLEGRLTWRLDRLLYSDDEPSLERMRLDQEEARGKVAGRVLEALFQWQRAWLSVHKATPGSREETDATMRLIESEAGLDVMTGGWFGAWAAEAKERDNQSSSDQVPQDSPSASP
jgi:hypothetical protein